MLNATIYVQNFNAGLTGTELLTRVLGIVIVHVVHVRPNAKSKHNSTLNDKSRYIYVEFGTWNLAEGENISTGIIKGAMLTFTLVLTG